jgi:uncharacterized membrane protein
VGPLILIVLAPVAVLLVIDLIGIFVIKGWVGFLFVAAFGVFVAMVGYLGIFQGALMATRGETVDFAKAFQTDRWGEWIGFAIVYGLMVAIGLAVCYVGALVVIAFWGLAPFYFLDRRMKIGDAISASFQTTRSNSGLPVALAVLGLVGGVGGFVCIGWLVTIPLAIIGAAYLYRHATGQPVAP